MTKTDQARQELRGSLAVVMATYRRKMQRCIELQAHEEGQRVKNDHINKILKACKKADLAFVEDAELPAIRSTHHPGAYSLPASLDFQAGQKRAQRDMLKAGYRKTKEITLA